MKMAMEKFVVFQLFLFLCCLCISDSQSDFANHFKPCRRSNPDFDSCIKDALNQIRPFFKTGVKEYDIFPFDPFHAAEVVQVRGGPNFNYKLKLKNVMESGWTISQVTRFRSDFNKHYIQYTQSFPEKYLEGDYEIIGNVLGTKIANKGKWNLTLYDLVQTTTITRKPTETFRGIMKYNNKLKVNVDVQKIGNMVLHISNLLGGRAILLETMLDRVINTAWQPGFLVVRPLINDLVSTGFTDIFNRAFANFPFDEVIPE